MAIFGNRKKDDDTGLPAPAIAAPESEASAVAARRQLVPVAARKGPPVMPGAAARRSQTESAARAPAGNAAAQGRQLVVGRDITLNGEIRDCERLVVEGRVEAALIGSHTLVVVDGGSFRGPADVQEADISGTYEGDLTVHGRLSIQGAGRVTGKLRYREIEIRGGGVLSGDVEWLGRE